MRFTSTHDVDDVRLIMLIMLVRMIVDDDDGASSAVITKTLQSSATASFLHKSLGLAIQMGPGCRVDLRDGCRFCISALRAGRSRGQ